VIGTHRNDQGDQRPQLLRHGAGSISRNRRNQCAVALEAPPGHGMRALTIPASSRIRRYPVSGEVTGRSDNRVASRTRHGRGHRPYAKVRIRSNTLSTSGPIPRSEVSAAFAR